MDYKKIKADQVANTRNIDRLVAPTGNIYETVTILSKRANQIGLDLKKELDDKIEEFATPNDNLQEVFENREQIEIARFYERLPKPTLISLSEFLNGKVYYRKPSPEEEQK
ncbi:MAG: DNA-directed RNA polymerase subunit omega [Bacteroidales bacterium]|nr:DNA-directed RNA polymerase subunit omega [Bacteroidales bacterium]